MNEHILSSRQKNAPYDSTANYALSLHYAVQFNHGKVCTVTALWDLNISG